MENSPNTQKYVRVNQRTSAIELTLPPHLDKYASELKSKITKEFGFALMDYGLQEKIQTYIEEFLKEKGEQPPL